jgi:hypothetical protein
VAYAAMTKEEAQRHLKVINSIRTFYEAVMNWTRRRVFIEVRRTTEARSFSRERRVAMTGLASEGIAVRTCRPEEIREV